MTGQTCYDIGFEEGEGVLSEAPDFAETDR